jgi:DNA-binding beta-propeller fold protein YncE
MRRIAFGAVAGFLVLAASAWALGRPLTFSQPTSIELEPSGTLLLVENDPGRVLRVDPATGQVTVLVPSVPKPYSIARTPSGRIFFSASSLVYELGARGGLTVAARIGAQVGPLGAGVDGTLYFTTGSALFRLAAGSHRPVRIGANMTFAAPHGVAVARDGAVLVSDTEHDRILRVDRATGRAAVFARIRSPRGIDVAGDATVYVIDAAARRVVHLSGSGARLGFVGPVFGDPYDLQVAPDRSVYVLEPGAAGLIRRVTAAGKATAVTAR